MNAKEQEPLLLYATSTRAGTLSDAEQEAVARFMIPKRRADFERGRHAAHALLRARFGCQQVEVIRDEEGEKRGRPISVVDGKRVAVGLSISHAGEWAVAAMADGDVGVDLIEQEDHGTAFRAEVFRDGERAAFAATFHRESPAHIDCIAFAAKEAALKLLGVGFRRGLREIEIVPSAGLSIDTIEPDTVSTVQVHHRFRVCWGGNQEAWRGGVWRLQTAFVVGLLRPIEARP